MKLRFMSVMYAVLALPVAVAAQDSGSASPAGRSSGQENGGYGQRGGRGGGGMSIGAGRGLMGTVSEVAADHYTIKTDMGEVYTVHFSANTRIVKQPAGMRGPGGGGGQGAGGGYGRGGYGGGNPAQEIQATDIKVGDAIAAIGDVDATAKSVGAMRIMQLDPDTAKRIQEMTANFGKTWLQGKVTAIKEATITLTGTLDNTTHTVVVDENTTFRRHREPITLADIQAGDTIRVEGAVKNGVFAATTVSMGGMMGGPRPNAPSGASSGPPPSAPPQ